MNKEALMDYERDVGKKELFEQFLKGARPEELAKYHTHYFDSTNKIPSGERLTSFDEDFYDFIEEVYHDEYWAFVNDCLMDHIDIINTENDLMNSTR